MRNSTRNMPRRLGRVGLALGLVLCIGAWSAPMAAASGPVITPVESPPIDFPAGSVCTDPVRFENIKLHGMSVESAMAAALSAPAAGRGRVNRAARARDGLTPREVEVLALVGDGRSDVEISEALYISPKTASVHVANIKGKLGVASRVEVALRARDLGLRRDASEPNRG